MMSRLCMLFTLLITLCCCQQQKQDAKLTFVYWMPYDNNLSAWADSIHSMIQVGIRSEDIVVTVQSDLAGEAGMTRAIITSSGIVREQIADESSLSGQSFADYLTWVGEKISSDNYAVIFLDHGGKLDEIGLDEFPEKGYLRIDSARMALERFNKINGRKIKLLYLQVCTKGSVEPIYEFKDVADYSLFSQTILGAPNFYYTSFFDGISEPDVGELSGLDLAKSILEKERKDMYYSLVCTDNAKFDSFERELKNFLGSYEELTEYTINANKPLFYEGQMYWDLAAFVKSFEGVSGEELLRSMEDLIVINQINPNYSDMVGYCGLSLLAMDRNYLEHVEQYQHLKFFQGVDVKGFYSKSVDLLKKN